MSSVVLAPMAWIIRVIVPGLGIVVGDRQRDALRARTLPDDDELAGTPDLRDPGRLDDEADDVRGELLALDDGMQWDLAGSGDRRDRRLHGRGRVTCPWPRAGVRRSRQARAERRRAVSQGYPRAAERGGSRRRARAGGERWPSPVRPGSSRRPAVRRHPARLGPDNPRGPECWPGPRSGPPAWLVLSAARPRSRSPTASPCCHGRAARSAPATLVRPKGSVAGRGDPASPRGARSAHEPRGSPSRRSTRPVTYRSIASGRAGDPVLAGNPTRGCSPASENVGEIPGRVGAVSWRPRGGRPGRERAEPAPRRLRHQPPPPARAGPCPSASRAPS